MKLTPSQFGYIYSALQAAEREETAGERRRHSRIEVEDTVAVTDAATGRAYKAIMRDICFTGISILQSVPAAVRDQLIVDLRHRKAKPYRVRCVVANVREMAEGVFCIGCAFAGAEPTTPTSAAEPSTAAAPAASPPPPAAPTAPAASPTPSGAPIAAAPAK